jgi:subtilisin family serine protease
VSEADESVWIPAWSDPFLNRTPDFAHPSPFDEYDRERAWGGATGAGVTVAIIDSGVDPDHPLVGGRLVRSVVVERDGDEFRVDDNGEPGDVVGHGTACAGIIHGLAPEADIVSVRVLGPDNRGSGLAFAHGLEWVIEAGLPVANLSLSSKSEELFPAFHDLVDRAYFANCLLVCSASNTAGVASYPSLFASVVSVASHDVADPFTFFYNPRPPVEFGAWGVNVPVAWTGGGTIRGSGNSFAAPHVAGIAALIKSKHPRLTPFELKTVLARVASPPDAGRSE